VTLQPAGQVKLDPVARAKDGLPVVFGIARISAGPALRTTVTIAKGNHTKTVYMLADYPAVGEVATSPVP
jgi:hypothetical protein